MKISVFPMIALVSVLGLAACQEEEGEMETEETEIEETEEMETEEMETDG